MRKLLVLDRRRPGGRELVYRGPPRLRAYAQYPPRPRLRVEVVPAHLAPRLHLAPGLLELVQAAAMSGSAAPMSLNRAPPAITVG